MQYGLALPTGGECGDPSFLLELAELAEGSGWDGVFVEDYIRGTEPGIASGPSER